MRSTGPATFLLAALVLTGCSNAEPQDSGTPAPSESSTAETDSASADATTEAPEPAAVAAGEPFDLTIRITSDAPDPMEITLSNSTGERATTETIEATGTWEQDFPDFDPSTFASVSVTATVPTVGDFDPDKEYDIKCEVEADGQMWETVEDTDSPEPLVMCGTNGLTD